MVIGGHFADLQQIDDFAVGREITRRKVSQPVPHLPVQCRQMVELHVDL